MRIVHLTPGTGSFYCGTCLRDRTLVRALQARGHDVSMVPMYLPSYPEDGRPREEGPIRMGAVNMYLQEKLPACRLLPSALTDLLDAPGLLRWVSKRAGGATDPAFLGRMTRSMLEGEEGRLGALVKKLAAELAEEGPYDAILLSNALLAGVARPLRESTGAAVVCTLQGESPYLDALPEPHRSAAWKTLAERAADVDGFIAVSRCYADQMIERLDLDPDKVTVILNGMDVEQYPARTPAELPSPPTLGFLARMCADKGLPLLVDAFLALHERGRVPDLVLKIAGVELEEDRPLVAALRQKLDAAGLSARVTFHPNVERDAKWEFLRSLSVLSVPATADESFGLYLLEAMAAGVPVVQPNHAAFPEILAATGGGLLCAPDDPLALATSIEHLLLDPDEAQALGEHGRTAVHEHFTADRMAREVEALLEGIRDERSASTG